MHPRVVTNRAKDVLEIDLQTDRPVLCCDTPVASTACYRCIQKLQGGTSRFPSFFYKKLVRIVVSVMCTVGYVAVILTETRVH